MSAPTRPDSPASVAVIGGGPAGLMAAEVLRAGGCQVDLYERMGSVGRKFLLAGKGGLNLTHAEPATAFRQRFSDRSAAVSAWLDGFDADALRAWARGLGVDTFVGSSGRVFPQDLKAAPLLRGWVRRLRQQGVRLHMQHRWTGFATGNGSVGLHFEVDGQPRRVDADAAVLALGGASWPQLGSDGAWAEPLRAAGVDVAPLQPANCGFEVAWSDHLRSRHAGAPLKPVALALDDTPSRQGELVITAHGLEGGLMYALSATLRERLARAAPLRVHLDLFPGRDAPALAAALTRPRGTRSLGEHLRRTLKLEGARAALVFECTRAEDRADPARLAARLKALPLDLLRARPVTEAISTAGGVRLEALDAQLMLRTHPGVFCAGEMLDWEAPTGGYLLTASFASGHRAAHGLLHWLATRDGYARRSPSP